MSHFAKYECKIKDIDALKKAIVDLGYGWEDTKQVKSRYGTYTQDVVLGMKTKSKGGESLPFGFAKQGDTYQLVGDFYGTSINSTKLTKDLTQHSIKNQVIDWMLDNNMSYDVRMEGEIMYVEGELSQFA